MECGWIGEYEGEFPGELEHTCEPVEGVDPFFPEDEPVQTMSFDELPFDKMSKEDQERIQRIKDRQAKLGQRKPCNCGENAQRNAILKAKQ